MSLTNERNINFSLNEYKENSTVREIKITKESAANIEIKKAIDELEDIRQYFDTVEAPELIEYAIYREKAAITRLSYLLRMAKDIKPNPSD